MASSDRSEPTMASAAAAVTPDADPPELRSALSKAMWRLLPLGMAVVAMNNIDRSNITFAALTFNRDNHFNAPIFSLGLSLFFVTYAIFQVPSNLVMLRVGARPWLAFIVTSWGVVATCMALIKPPWTYYLLRLLLGALEAGSVPAVWHVLTLFFPAKRLTVPFSFISLSILLANLLAAPLATGFLAMNGIGGLRGWQWLFILEGAPAVLLGIVVFFMMPSSLESADFLTESEAATLSAAVAADAGGATASGAKMDPTQGEPGHTRGAVARALPMIMSVLKNRYMWAMMVAVLLSSITAYTALSYMPIIISNLLAGTALTSATVALPKGASPLLPVALTTVPYGLGAITTLLLARSAQHHDEHFIHTALPLLISGVALGLFPVVARVSIVGGFVLLALSAAAGSATHSPSLILATRLCFGQEQAVALPMINTIMVLGGVIAPLVAGAILKNPQLGGFTWLFVIMACVTGAEVLVLLALRAWVMKDGGLPDGGRHRSAPGAAEPSGGYGSKEATTV